MNETQAYDEFWNSFDLLAFDETRVPEEITDERGNIIKVKPPYITYAYAVNDFGYPVSLTASLWDRSQSWAFITSKQREISECIGRGGVMIPYENGAMWIKKGSPFAQRVTDEDDSIRRILLNIEVEYIS